MRNTIALLFALVFMGCTPHNNGNNYEGRGHKQTIQYSTEFDHQPPTPKPMYRPYKNPFDVHFKANGWQTF